MQPYFCKRKKYPTYLLLFNWEEKYNLLSISFKVNEGFIPLMSLLNIHPVYSKVFQKIIIIEEGV